MSKKRVNIKISQKITFVTKNKNKNLKRKKNLLKKVLFY